MTGLLTPDAIIFPPGFASHPDCGDRPGLMWDYLEATLGGKAHINYGVRGGEMRWAVRRARETEFFPRGHPREGQERFRWVDQENGCRFGFFVDDEARDACEN